MLLRQFAWHQLEQRTIHIGGPGIHISYAGCLFQCRHQFVFLHRLLVEEQFTQTNQLLLLFRDSEVQIFARNLLPFAQDVAEPFPWHSQILGWANTQVCVGGYYEVTHQDFKSGPFPIGPSGKLNGDVAARPEKEGTARAVPALNPNPEPLLDHQLGDGLQLHVGGALIDLADFRVAPVFLHWIILSESVTAVDLDGERRHALRHLGSV